MLFLYISFALITLITANPLDSTNDVSLIFVGFRHGERNPFKFLKNDTARKVSGWGWEGEGELNNVGKMQAFGFGQFLRKRYSNLIPEDYLPCQVEVVSSSAKRCQMTLMSVMSGLFPPSNRALWNSGLAWQPVPFDVNDPMLRMENVTCPTYSTSFQPIKDGNLEESLKMLEEKRDLVDYVVFNTGVNATLNEMGDVADNIRSMIYNNVSLPDWVERPTLDGYSKQSLIDAIDAFTRVIQVQCAFSLTCARATAGLWLNDIVQILKQKAGGLLPTLKSRFYSTHIQSVLSLMQLTGMGVTGMPTTGGVILEFKPTPASVRAIYHEPLPRQPPTSEHRSHVIQLPYCGDRDWCPLATFLQFVEKEVVADWQQFCQLPKC